MNSVRPLAGAGIEIHRPRLLQAGAQFAPSRGRELKYISHLRSYPRRRVRPLAGAGIEISKILA